MIFTLTYRINLIFTMILVGTLTSSVYGANVVSLNSAAGFAGENVVVTLSLDNADTLAGIQFTIRDTPNHLTLVSVEKTSRLSAFSTPDFKDRTDLGVANIIGFSFGGWIEPGTGAILNLTYAIPSNAPPGDIGLVYDQIVLATHRAFTVAATGVPGAIKVINPVILSSHPVGQPENKFDETAHAVNQDLFRFGITGPTLSFRMENLTFDLGLSQLNSSDLTAVQLFEDTNGDGTADGLSLFTSISIVGSNIHADGLDLLIPAGATRYYILKATVALNQVSDELSLSISSAGVGGNIEDAVLGVIPAQSEGNTTDAVHTATGFTGDISFDLRRNIIDVVKLIGVLLGNISMDGNNAYYDINNDTQVDITDTVSLIQQILNGETQP
jgi:hypothetical protein